MSFPEGESAAAMGKVLRKRAWHATVRPSILSARGGMGEKVSDLW